MRARDVKQRGAFSGLLLRRRLEMVRMMEGREEVACLFCPFFLSLSLSASRRVVFCFWSCALLGFFFFHSALLLSVSVI